MYVSMTQWESSHIQSQPMSRYSWGQSSCASNFEEHNKREKKTCVINDKTISLFLLHSQKNYYTNAL